MTWIRRIVVLQQEHDRVGLIVDEEEFTTRPPCTQIVTVCRASLAS